ncbi:MAG: excinuclease ABC subunit UvrA, partial [Patescibacteria group bacterium]
MTPSIKIKHARVNNLKNVSLDIPKNKLIVITGLSGSGKSSLAFDTIYAEGQRRYAESLSSYARQFMEVQDKPDVDEIQGLSPTIAIDQKSISQNPRSTVGTTTEIYDYLRRLFGRIGVQYDPETRRPVKQYTAGEITEMVRSMARSQGELILFSPIVMDGAVNAKQILPSLEQSGYQTVRLNGRLMELSAVKKYPFSDESRYTLELLIGRVTDIKKQNIMAFIEKALDLSNGFVVISANNEETEQMLCTFPYSQDTGKRFDPIEPRTFSFNSPYGACPRCTGLGYTLDVDPELVIPNPRLTLAEGAIQPWTRIVGNQSYYQKLLDTVAETHGFSVGVPVKDLPQKAMDILFYGTDGTVYTIGEKKVQFEGIVPNLVQRHAETDSDYIRKEIEQYMREKICPACNGKRLKPESLAVKVGDCSMSDIAEMSIEQAYAFFAGIQKHSSFHGSHKLVGKLSSFELGIALPIVKHIVRRLENLLQVGLYYLTLDRSVTTLAGGEAQRIRLSSQLSTGLTDVIYILDEPSIGLHPKDNGKLIETLRLLRDIGNTVIVVEHDADMMRAADMIIDVGPGAGDYGGEIIAQGTIEQIKRNKKSLTGRYLIGKEEIHVPKKIRKGNGKY